MLWRIIHIIEILFWLLLSASGAYILFFTIVSLVWRKPASKLSSYLENKVKSLHTDHYYSFLILFPAYNEDRVIVSSVQQFIGQYYPSDRFHAVVISDHMKPETNDKLRELPITLLTPIFEKSSKAKAMQYAMSHIKETYDFVVILDADNLVNSDFLENLNDACAMGHKAIQCHRCAKNSNNNIAVLDGISEEINNTIFRKAHNRIGLSSALIGSGMCFDFKWFKENVYKLSTAGEDRELEALLLMQGIYIHYEENIPVFDEKVSNKENFQNQRQRWMTAQIQSFLNMLPYIPQAIKSRNINFIDKTMQQALIPRSMLIVFTFTMATLMTFISQVWCMKWWLLFLFICLSLYYAIPKELRNYSILSNILSVPMLVWKMILNILKIDRKNTDFIHTIHDK